MTRFVVSGGDFQRLDGSLTFIDLDNATGRLMLFDEIWVDHPRTEQAVPGKGFTGMHLDGSSAWVCFSNLLVKMDLASGAITDQIEDVAFNDLHQIAGVGDRLLVANTGHESVDVISLDDRTIERMDLLGAFLRSRRPEKASSEDTKPHVHHLTSVDLTSTGDFILGLGRQSRILNASRWTWIGPKMNAPVHDVSCDQDDAVWCTTVNGEVHKFPVAGAPEAWSLEGRQERVGWTRGLAVTDRGLLVGTTAIRDSNRDYYRSLVRAEANDTKASLTWIPFDGGPSTVVELPDASSRKVFTICVLEG